MRGARTRREAGAALALTLTAGEALACSCARETLAEQSARAALVVRAQTLTRWEAGRNARSLLRVEEVAVGEYPHRLLLVRHARAGAACGVRVRRGGFYTQTFHRPVVRGSPARINLCRVWVDRARRSRPE